ncbi:MAG: bifunctional diguanylate cyclase/phosphodiesterase [Arenimonas sp.]|uniref:bifunctional diguanylate cyclase/phosphodiesterase n=1 Tax=Arenimonas sp. TaxID=1872635 RepID=UPI003C0C99E6
MAYGTEIGIPSLTPTPRKDVGTILRETQGALQQLETANRSQTQMPLRLVGWSAILIAALLILQSLAAMADLFGSGHHLRVPELGTINGTLILLCGLAMLPERNQNSTAVKIAMLSICILTTIGAIILNGAVSALFLTSMFVLVHIMLTPYRALWFSIGTLLLIIPISNYFLDYEGQYLITRFVIGGLVTLIIMQVLMRFISGTNSKIITVTENLSKLALQLDEELLQSNQARDTATMTDTTTGLLNSFGFETAIRQALSEQPYSRRRFLLALNFQRLEEFNAIMSANERTFILQCLVARIRDMVGADALIARTGRDDFSILLAHAEVDDSQMMHSIRTIQDVLRRPLLSTSSTILPSPAIGVSVWPEDSEDATELLNRAEVALQRAYGVKEGLPVRYQKHMHDEHIDQRTLSTDITAAINLDEFEMYYQPILDLQTGKLRKAEALIRWNHPTRGFLMPARFIPLAEASGQIIPITDWVLDHVLIQLRNFIENISPDFQISINMPAAYLEYCVENEAKMLGRLLAMQIPPRALIVEITEGSLLNMTPELLRFLGILESIGFQLAMDDFGVGFSNLSQLERLPLSYLKIDKSFVDGIEGSMQKLAICRAIVRIGHELGIRVVAEGIESTGQEKLLHEAGCDFGQGYLFAQPMPAEDFASFITDHSPLKNP